MRDETQELLREISLKEHELAARSAAEPWWPDPRPAWWATVTRIVVALGLLAGLAGIVAGHVAESRKKACTASSLRALLAGAPAIAWRHQHDGDCDVWISSAGLAEITCDHRVVYRGFGNMDGSAFSAIELYETTPNDHDLGRTAWLDGRDAWVGSFAHCHAGIACGRFELHDLAR